MKKGWVLLFVGTMSMLLSMQQWKNQPVTKELPIIAVKARFLENLQELKEKVTTLRKNALEDSTSVEAAFLELRMSFKEIEFLLAYLDREMFNTYINGAPLPKLIHNIPEVKIKAPKGLQRIEELVYEENLDVYELIEQLKVFSGQLEKITEATVNAQLTDPVAFEAMRFGLIRVYALGVTGFDSPGNPQKALSESAAFLKGIQQAVQYYSPYLEEVTSKEIHQLFENGIQQLNRGKFDTFDRLTFLRKVIQPLWERTLTIQKMLKVELPHQRKMPPMAVNYQAKDIFSDSFLNVEYYADFMSEENRGEVIQLGKLLFFDPILSKNGQRACASCHQPDKAFTDGNAKSLTTDTRTLGHRNAPTVLNSVLASEYFYDLRADRLSQQMDHVVFNPTEFATDYMEIIEKLSSSEEYTSLFSEVYGNEGITKNTITNAMANYVGSLYGFNSEFDQYIRGEKRTIAKSVVQGYNLFTGKAACATCHFVPTFSGSVAPHFDESETEVLGVPKTAVAPFEIDPDLGRYAGNNAKERVDFFQYSFKTPSIRNCELTGPYMHNGVYETLEEVVEFYNNGGGIGMGLDLPYQTLPADSLHLSKKEQKDLVAFMKSLTDTTGLTDQPKKLPSFPSNSPWNNRVIGGEY